MDYMSVGNDSRASMNLDMGDIYDKEETFDEISNPLVSSDDDASLSTINSMSSEITSPFHNKAMDKTVEDSFVEEHEHKDEVKDDAKEVDIMNDHEIGFEQKEEDFKTRISFEPKLEIAKVSSSLLREVREHSDEIRELYMTKYKMNTM